jgi:amidase
MRDRARRTRFPALLLLAAVPALAGCAAASSPPTGDDPVRPPATSAAGSDGAPTFDPVEATIAEIHEAMRAGRLTTRALVEASLARIEAYDRRGPALNALVVVHPRALAVADSLDGELRRTGRLVGPLHGIPVIVKDNYDTYDLPTTAGSAVLEGSVPPDDATQVRRVRKAGGIVLAKSNMAEWAFSPYETVGSALPGYTFNPYALNRVPAGSSGGTAAAVAASFGVVGLGTDTGNSIRGPSSHTALVGIRPTLGLTSRDGIVPLYLDRDVGGPMARTVEDAARLLDVLAGPDPADPVTLESPGHVPESYTASLDAEGLRGARIGVLRQISAEKTADPRVAAAFDEALAALRRSGATVIDPVAVEGWSEIMDAPLYCRRFRHDIEQYLATLGPDAPVRTLEEIIASEKAHPSVRDRLEYFTEFPTDWLSDGDCQAAVANADRLRTAVRTLMESESLDALAFPTWDNPPRLIGDLESPHGNNSWQIAPPTGFPALTVPMGWVEDRLPVGLQLLGLPWSEPALIRLAFAYEQATRHRRPPGTTPTLGSTSQEPPR